MKTEYEWQLDKNKQASFRRRLFIFVAVIVIIALVFGLGYLWLESSVSKPVADSIDTYIDLEVAEGMGTEEITDKLVSEDLIDNGLAFKYYVWSEKLAAEFKPGKFSLSPGMTIPQIVSILTDDRSGEVELTILEGWTNEQIAKIVSEEFGTTNLGVQLPSRYIKQLETDFIEATEQSYDFDFLADVPPEQRLEGYLFPDTYRFYRSATMPEIVERMLRNFGEKVDADRRAAFADRGWTLNEAVTLASIVQKEGKVEEMPIVAGIFIARLKSGQALESDATVNYVTGKGVLQPTIADTKIESPYNTYRNKGLPPGPICNPGIKAIDAVINPEITSYRYFLNTPEGDTIFSETFEEHLANKELYLDGE